jgi:hypothetical protein
MKYLMNMAPSSQMSLMKANPQQQHVQIVEYSSVYRESEITKLSVPSSLLDTDTVNIFQPLELLKGMCVAELILTNPDALDKKLLV